jgi:hypothetical protein
MASMVIVVNSVLGISLRREHRRVSPLVVSSAPGPGGQLTDTGRKLS